MPKYSRAHGSQFPGKMIDLGEHKDVDNIVAPIMMQMQDFIYANNMEEAYRLYNENEELLRPYCINARYLNWLEEEIYNGKALLMSKAKSIISDIEPEGMEDGSFWLREY